MRANPISRTVAAVAAVTLAVSPAYADVTNCPQTSPTTGWAGASLDTGTVKNGIVYDSTGARLQLQNGTGQFRSTSLGISDHSVFAAVGDFDHDGWADFAGAAETDSWLRIYRNRTFDNPAPDWNDVNAVRTPSFPTVRELIAPTSGGTAVRRRPVAVGDFNGDGWDDVFIAEHRSSSGLDFAPYSAKLFLNQASNDGSGNPRFNAAYDAMYNSTALTSLGMQPWGGSTVQVLDYNGDRKLDLLYGSGDSGGTLRVFLNNCTLATVANPPAPPAPLPCSTSPKFVYSSVLITSMGMGASGTARSPVFSYSDIDGDGFLDLVAGSPACCSTAGDRLRIWKGQSGGGLASTSQSVTFQGGATVVFLHDFSGDGKVDLVVGTDNFNYNANHGGDSFYWVNNGTATPFSDTPMQLTTHDDTTLIDYDVGFMFDYDHDPSGTMDLMIADGNHTGSFFIQANRVAASYVECGTAASGVVDLGALSSTEMVVTAARIHPTYSLNGGSIAFYLSNETPENWVLATACPDTSGDLCVSFPHPVGRDVRWKVEMCSNSFHTQTPILTNVSATFDYTAAREHFRAGVIVSDGVAYLGGFRQPGDRGHLFAVNAGLSQTYWDATDSIDGVSDSARKIYTSNTSGTSRLDFTTSNASNTSLIATMGAADGAQVATVVDWVRSARFGVGNDGINKSRVGAIENSTPAVLTKPGFPIWYVYAGAADKLRHQSFQTAQAARRNLILFGSKDGMIHAVQTMPTAMTTSPSGTEAWAFVPPKVASGMIADYTSSVSAGITQIGSYPDGSPTVADYRKADGNFATAVVMSSGAGGKSLMALDVTSTISASGTVTGPTPMWTVVPGEADAGQGFSKPAVARVLLNGVEKFIAVAATGIGYDNPTAPFTKGRIVSAYDMATGRLLWKFQAKCAITSDIATFETDDDLEQGAPTFNGYADRAVFADACGYVYKVEPGRDLDGAWNDNTGLGAIAVDGATTTQPDGSLVTTPQYALFSSKLTSGALAAESPIAGTLAVRSDSTTRVVLFFGTGGLESHAVTEANEFYGIYADTGEIRSKMTGACAGSMCEKFYGGAVVTTQQVIFTRTTDPAVGTSTCDTGSTKVAAVSLEAGSGDAFAVDFTQDIASAVMGALYGDAGALYFATLAGDVSRIGTPRSADAGGDSASTTISPFGQGNESATVGTVGTNTPLTLLGWRQVY
ncbi:MAG: VCBS repeat-containing protein [Myxococcales bacterium]|nr:VCBS repeat-containing protein [Myxococcales bacterium]